MPGPDLLSSALAVSGPLFGYGPAPGIELIPYFLGLLAWVGLALVSILLSPLTALLRRLRKGEPPSPAEPKTAPTHTPEPAGEGRHDSE